LGTIAHRSWNIYDWRMRFNEKNKKNLKRITYKRPFLMAKSSKKLNVLKKQKKA
jgi:hypothetical protein